MLPYNLPENNHNQPQFLATRKLGLEIGAGRIAFQRAPEYVWHDVVVEAERHGSDRLRALIEACILRVPALALPLQERGILTALSEESDRDFDVAESSLAKVRQRSGSGQPPLHEAQRDADIDSENEELLGPLRRPNQISRVGVVSTLLEELQSHRQSAIQAVSALGDFAAEAIELTEVSTDTSVMSFVENIASCEALVVIAGREYGPVLEGLGISIVHFAYRVAVNKRRPVFAFIRRLPESRDVRAEPGSPHMDDLYRELQTNEVVDSFDEPSELASRVVAALLNWRYQTRNAQSGSLSLPPQPRVVHPYPLDNHFTGRSAERLLLSQWVDDQSAPVCVLEAIGGEGKSALAWFWSQFDVLGAPLPLFRFGSVPRRHPPMKPVEGMFWWSFYDQDAGFTRFVSEALLYAQGREIETGVDPRSGHSGRAWCQGMTETVDHVVAPGREEGRGRETQENSGWSASDRVQRLIQILQTKRLLLVLDGFERELQSYGAGFRASHGDDPPAGEDRFARQCVDTHAARFLEALASGYGIRSRVLLTSRLLPSDLQDRSGSLLPGCQRLILGPLAEEDLVALFRHYKLRTHERDILALARKYGFNPLAMRLIIGVIVNDPVEEGDWRAAEGYDPVPDLIAKQHHVLEVAYQGLSVPNQQLLSCIATYRGPIGLEEVTVVERARSAGADGATQRDKQALKAALRNLRDRNLLMCTRRKEQVAYDLHPVVRRYAFHRLLNGQHIHEAITKYFESYATHIQLIQQSDLEPLLELFHQQLVAGHQNDALRLLRFRVWQPLVNQFHDLRSAHELCSALAQDNVALRATFSSADNGTWFNQTYARVLRSCGLALKAYRWQQSADAAVIKTSAIILDLSESFRQHIEETINRVRLARAIGDLSGALRICENEGSNRRLSDQNWIERAPASPRVRRLMSEEAFTRACSGQFEHASRIFGDDKRGNRSKSHDEPLGVVDLLCEAQYRAHLARWGEHMTEAVEIAKQAASWASGSAASDIETMQVSIQTECQLAICLFWERYDLLGHLRRDLMSEDVRSQNLEELGNSSLSLEQRLRTCRDLEFLETEIDVLLALAHIKLAMGDCQTASRHAEAASALAERGGFVLLGADACILIAAVAGRCGQREDACMAIQQAEAKAQCNGGALKYVPALSLAMKIRSLLDLGEGRGRV